MKTHAQVAAERGPDPSSSLLGRGRTSERRTLFSAADGSPEKAEVRRSFEPRFGFDFSRVPVHDRHEGPRLTAALSAQAHAAPQVQLQSDEKKRKTKPKEKAPRKPKITVSNVDDEVGPLTEEIAKKVLSAYGSPLVSDAKALIDAFNDQGVSPWIGLAIMKEESSFGNQANNPGLDERNLKNPFSVHFTSPERWPEGCKRNALLIEDPSGSYESTVNSKCSAKKVRLTTFEEAAKGAARTVRRVGLAKYREAGGYEEVLNGHLANMVKKIGLQRK